MHTVLMISTAISATNRMPKAINRRNPGTLSLEAKKMAYTPANMIEEIPNMAAIAPVSFFA